MVKRVVFSHQNLELSDVLNYFQISRDSLKAYYKNVEAGVIINENIAHMTPHQLSLDYQAKIEELEYSVCFSMLSALEAHFRMDYIQRVYKRYRDDLSREFRLLYLEKENRASLPDDILELWKKHYPSIQQLISDYKGALFFRNWLAHGRYWSPKFGRKYDFDTIYLIADRIYANLTFCI